MSRPQVLDAEDKERFGFLFRQAVLELRDEYADDDDLMTAVVAQIVKDIERLQDARDGWAIRWGDRVAELALMRLAEAPLPNRGRTGHSQLAFLPAAAREPD